ncbi:MAG TPA: CPBP family intramembrane glutamic endopeptidase [Solirubrobacteraceae bacterium]
MTTTAPPPPQSDARPELPPWRAWTGPAALLLAIAIALVLSSVVYVIGAIATGHTKSTPGANLVATVVGDFAFIASAVFFAQLAARPTPEQFGLRPARLRPAIKWMALGYGAFWLVTAGWFVALGIHDKDRTLDDLGSSTISLAAAAVLVTVIAPIAEEVLFRGYIFTALRGWAGVWGAAAITGVLFGAIHIDPDRPTGFLVPLAFLGFVLCLIYWRTRSLYPCIALHSINNAIAYGATESWSWQIPLLVVGALALITALLAPARRLAGPWPRPA